MLLLLPFSRKFAFWGSILLIIGFIILTGASASVIRAGILAGLVAWGRQQGRRINYAILILLTAVLMILANPYILKNDISFQLSFLAFAGLIWISPMLNSWKFFYYLPEKMRTILAETLSAQIAVLPILFYNFGIISIIAPLSNILILPVIPASMLMGFLTGIFGLAPNILAKIFGFISFVILKYIIYLSELLGRLNWSALVLQTDEWWWIAPYYLMLIVWIKKSNRISNYSNL